MLRLSEHNMEEFQAGQGYTMRCLEIRQSNTTPTKQQFFEFTQQNYPARGIILIRTLIGRKVHQTWKFLIKNSTVKWQHAPESEDKHVLFA